MSFPVAFDTETCWLGNSVSGWVYQSSDCTQRVQATRLAYCTLLDQYDSIVLVLLFLGD